MNEDHDLNQLQDAWKGEPPVSPAATSSTLKRVKIESRYAAWRTWLISLTTCSIIAFFTSLCVLHRSVLSYTFTVIGWSAFFAFGSYLLGTRDFPDDLALETTTALKTRMKRLMKGARLLDFGRSLVGVETLICLGFWIVVRHSDGNSIWFAASMIAFGGVFLYGSLSWALARTRRELSGLESITTALHK
jgi:hypothetical protein